MGLDPSGNALQLNEQLGWNAAHVIVDNPTNQWLLLPDVGRFVAPGEHGGTYPLPGVGVAKAQWVAPAGFFQPTVIAGQFATLVFLHEDLNAAPSSPIALPPSAGVLGQATKATYLGQVVIPPASIQSGVFRLPTFTSFVRLILWTGNVNELAAVGVSTAKIYVDQVAIGAVHGTIDTAAIDPADLTIQVTGSNGPGGTVNVFAIGPDFSYGLGQRLASDSLPVVLAADQAALPLPMSQLPNKRPFASAPTIAAGGLATIISPLAGQTVYLFAVALSFDVAPAGGTPIGLEDSTGVFLGWFSGSVVNPPSMELHGAAVPAGRGISLHNYSANPVTPRVSAIYSQG